MKYVLKVVLVATAVSTLFATATLAADLPEETLAPVYKPEPIQATDYDWSGAYAGLNIGVGFNGEFNNNGGLDLDTDTSLLAGGTIGFNHQFNNFILGLETDLNYTRLDASDAGVSADLDFLGTVTARAGITPFERVHTYIEGGYAFGQVDASTPLGSDQNIQSGFVLGTGAEFALTDNILSGVEYNYVDLNEQALPGGLDSDFSGHTVKFNLKYKF